jgi:hypothetical protein
VRQIEIDQIVAELARHIGLRRMTISDLHERGSGLWAASMAFVS